jgi:aminoglycoside phosphotransferase
VKTYNENIASNSKVELVHLSRDRDEDAATAWAQKENMPWPTILSEDADVKQLIMPYFPGGRMGVPSYVLVDQTGKEVARGKTAAFAKIKEME